jgi:predicted dehydrogenase
MKKKYSSKHGLTRRNFMATAGAAAGVMIASGYSPFSYAQNEKIRVASIGTGGQGCLHLRDGLARAKNIQVVAVCDVYKPHLQGGWIVAGRDKNIRQYRDYRKMLDDDKNDDKFGFDAVVIATPIDTHHQVAMDCLDAGKYVFCEKTMCYAGPEATLEEHVQQCRDLVQKVHDKGKFLQIGHQRRYNPDYNHALGLVWDEGVIGRIHHIDAQWHRNNDWRRPLPGPQSFDEEMMALVGDFLKERMSSYPNFSRLSEEEKQKLIMDGHINWRIYTERSGGLMTELATHALDVVNWYLDANPVKVVGYGGIDYWRDGRTAFDNINVCFEYNLEPGQSRAHTPIEARGELHSDARNDAYSVRAMYSSITANAQRGASEWMQGDKGTLRLTELGCLYYREATADVKWAAEGRKDAAEENAIIVTTGGTRELSNEAVKNAEPVLVDTDRSVDQLQFEAFANDIMTGGTPRANVMVGMKSAICALTGMEAMRQAAAGDVAEIKIKPEWYQFGFETDDSSMYGPPVEV